MASTHKRVATLTVLAVLAICYAGPAAALDPDDVRVTREGGSYRTELTFDVPASVSEVQAILTDFEHPERLTPAVKQRKVIKREDGVARVRTDIRGCILFFCKSVTLTQDVSVADGRIDADIVPDESDFKSGYLRWSVSTTASGSTVVYESVIEPDFFVPPLIGRYFMRRWLQKQIYGIAQRLRTEAVTPVK